MAAPGADLIPVVRKSYDLCAALYTQANRFPRAQRGLSGRAMLENALAMLVSLTVANRRTDQAETLREASGRLDALRIALRLGFVSNGGYADLSKGADEVGRMLGGWLKHEQGGAAAQAGKAPSGIEGAPAPAKRAGGVRYTMRSPTVERYLRCKLEHPRSVVFITVGAFCQTFFEDATECGRVLRVAVRDLAAESESARIFTCGVPKAKLEKYVGLLRRAGREAPVE
ncbi:MAG: hypothetical protein ACREVR_17085 [Burkholderiales bacterium]